MSMTLPQSSGLAPCWATSFKGIHGSAVFGLPKGLDGTVLGSLRMGCRVRALIHSYFTQTRYSHPLACVESRLVLLQVGTARPYYR